MTAVSEVTISKYQLESLAASLTTDRQREELSNIILVSTGAHKKSEGIRPVKEVQAKQGIRVCGHDVAFSQLEYPEWIRTAISDRDISRIMNEAARAGLTRKQQYVWVLSEAGYNQAEISTALKISQGAVSGILTRAREALRNHIENNGGFYFVYLQEVHRGKKQHVSTGDPLPREIEEYRQIIESEPDITTHINPEHPRCVEIRRKEEVTELVPFNELKSRACLTGGKYH